MTMNYVDSDLGPQKKIAVIPVIGEKSTLDDFVSRCAWYFQPYLERITLISLFARETLTANICPPDKFDPIVSTLLPEILKKVRVAAAHEDNRTLDQLQEADVILGWRRLSRVEEKHFGPVIAQARKRGAFFDLDVNKSRMEGSLFLWAGVNWLANQETLAEECWNKLRRHADRFRKNRAYIFGTGPSLHFAYEHDFSDGVCVIANSIVGNKKLVDHLNPVAIVAGDPIFHAGCSRYAAQFRSALRERMLERDLLLFVPMRDYLIYLNALPDALHDRVIGVPFEANKPYNFNLLDAFYVKPLPNVLTLLLIPVVSTFSSDIWIVGCDGRPLQNDKYFWSHDKASQFTDSMQNIRDVHPAFFAIDYNDYYKQHCEAVEDMVNRLEALGKSVASLTPSYIPALKDRYHDPAASGSGVVEVISLDPDGVSDHGHFLSYDERLADAVKEVGLRFTLVGNQQLSETFKLSSGEIERIFTINSWAIGSQKLGPKSAHVELFKTELERLITLRRERGICRKAVLYMYCGSFPHARAIYELIQKYDEYSANVNLFWTSFVPYRERAYRKAWKLFLDEVSAQERLTLTVPTAGLREGISSTYGIDLRIAPHPSTTFSDSEVEHPPVAHKVSASEAQLTLLYPGGASLEKGIDLTADIIERVNRLQAGRFKHVVRFVDKQGIPAPVREALTKIRRVASRVLEGEMTNEVFGRFLNSADIVVLPYRSVGFRERTSGLLIDALVLEKPVVVFENTWLADVVTEFGFGVAVPEGNIDAVAAAVVSISSDIGRYRSAAATARRTYSLTNNWRALANSIVASDHPVVVAAKVSERTVGSRSAPNILEYERAAEAHIDESRIISVLQGSADTTERVMIDVGAHFGGSAAHFVDRGWAIYCFEPDPANREKLIARFNDKPNVRIDARAVGDHSETKKPFFSSSESTGISGLHPFHDTHKQSSVVDVITVAEIVDQHGLGRSDFLKIDVEGFDFAVLRGVPWERIKPLVIECEFEDAKTVPLGHTWRDMAEFLVAKGYTVYVSEWHPIIRYGIRHDWRGLKRYPCELASKDAWGNLLAFLEDPGAEAIGTALKKCVSVKNPSSGSEASTVAASQQPSDRNGEGKMSEPANQVPATTNGTSSASETTQPGVLHTMVTRLRGWARRRYKVYASAVKARSLVLFRAGQVVAWTMRAVRRRPRIAVTAFVSLAVLAVAPYHASIWPYRGVFWAAAAGLSVMAIGAIAAAVINEALRRLLGGLRADMDARVVLARQAGDRRTAALEARIASLAKEVADVKTRFVNAQAASEKARTATESELGAVKARIEDASKRVAELAGQLERETGSLGERIDRAQAASEEAKAAAESGLGLLKAKVNESTKRVAALAEQVEQNAAFQRFNRILTPEHVETLHTVWSKRLGVRTTKPSLAYMAHRIRVTEQNAVGRLATTIEDAVLRMLVSSAVRAKKLEILEIGTLFGIGLAMLYEYTRSRYDAVHVTAIDPLDGYYNEKVPDVLLNIPVSKATFWRNMDVAGIPRKDITLIESMSTSDEAIAKAKRKRYDVLVIDGDHSYSGVRSDFENYLGMMRQGGFIIFDDYGAENWPDVKRFIDSEVVGNDRVDQVGSEWRTAVFRVGKTADSA